MRIDTGLETQVKLVAIKAKLDILDSKEFKSINNETLNTCTAVHN